MRSLPLIRVCSAWPLVATTVGIAHQSGAVRGEASDAGTALTGVCAPSVGTPIGPASVPSVGRSPAGMPSVSAVRSRARSVSTILRTVMQMRRRSAVVLFLLAAAGPPPATQPEAAIEHLKGTWKITLVTRRGATCSADGVTFTDAAAGKPIRAEFPLSCGDTKGVSGFVQITVSNPGRQDAEAHVDAQAMRNHPGKLYNMTGRISWPSPDHLVITPRPSQDGTIREFKLIRVS